MEAGTQDCISPVSSLKGLLMGLKGFVSQRQGEEQEITISNTTPIIPTCQSEVSLDGKPCCEEIKSRNNLIPDLRNCKI